MPQETGLHFLNDFPLCLTCSQVFSVSFIKEALSTIVQQIGSHQVHHLQLDGIDSGAELYTK